MRTQDLILVVDDDARARSEAAGSLRRSGYRVLETATSDEALALATVHQPALILLRVGGRTIDGRDLCRRLGRDVLLNHIPVVVMTDTAADDLDLRDVMGCIDDFLSGPFSAPQLELRISLALKRVRSMGGANPLTRLPGNVQIQEQIIERLHNDDPFALLYIDLDNFKAFNDHYGFLRGDEAIKLLARCAREAVVNHSPSDGFVGHVGGDDMAAIVPARAAEPVAHQIVNSWENLSPNLYEPEDARRGYIEYADRRGEMQRFPLASVSIGIASNATRPLVSHWHASELAAEMKGVAKSRDGSVIAVDRRREAPVDAERVPTSL